jgi:anti-sigma B factor antagonist
MDLTFHDEHDVAVVRVVGELDDMHSKELGQLFDRLLAEGRRQFVIDLKGVEFIDSSGLAMLVRCFQRARRSAASLSLADLTPPVLRTFELTRLDRAFDIRADVAEAIRYCTGKRS